MANLDGVTTLLVTTEYPPTAGGVGVSSQRIAGILARAGLEVSVAHVVQGEGPALLDENITVRQEGEVRVLEVRLSGHQGLGHPLYDEQHLVMRRGQELVHSLARLQREGDIRVLNGLFLSNVGLEVCAAARLTGARAMVSIRGNDIGKQFFLPGAHGALRTILESAHMVTSVSRDLLDLAGAVAPLDGKSMVISNSLDPALASADPPPRPTAAREGPPLIGSHGVFRYKKGIPYLLKAASLLGERGHDPRLLLVGGHKDRREEAAYNQALERFDLGPKVELTGLLPRQAAVARLSELDLAVYPSLFAEGCPSAVLEAMGRALPVVASSVGGIPDLIQHGETGLLVPPGDTAALAEAMERLLADPEAAWQMGRRARQAVLDRGEEREREAWCEAYRMALG